MLSGVPINTVIVTGHTACGSFGLVFVLSCFDAQLTTELYTEVSDGV